MSHDSELLNTTYQNAKMGTTGIGNIMGSVKDNNFKDVLQKQDKQYCDIAGEASQKLNTLGEKPKDINPMARIGAFISSETNTIIDSSASHIADMMIQGSTMGVTKLLTKCRECSAASPDTQSLAQRLVTTEQSNIEELKRFL